PAAARDNVSQERSGCDDLAVRVELPAEWIVQLSPGVPSAILRVRRVVQLRKIALVHLFGGHSNEARAARAKVRALVVAKEEELVPADRPTERAPKLVPLERSDSLVEKVPSIGLLVAQK